MTYELPRPLERAKRSRANAQALNPRLRRHQSNGTGYNHPAPDDPPVTLVLLDAIAFWRDLEGMEP